jgi:hypothetical protein
MIRSSWGKTVRGEEDRRKTAGNRLQQDEYGLPHQPAADRLSG